MKYLLALSLVVVSAVISSQSALPLRTDSAGSPTLSDLERTKNDQQRLGLLNPISPGPAMPPSDPSSNRLSPSTGPGSVMLSDVMGRDRSINIFAGLTRDVESVTQRLDDASRNSTVLAPLNSAVEKLPRKPWENARDYGTLGENAYEGEDGQERAQRNLRMFVEAHIIPVSPWPANHKMKPIGDDKDVWWEEKDGIKLIHPDNIEVMNIESTVSNGQVWIIKGVRKSS